MEECRTLEREVGGSKPTSAVLSKTLYTPKVLVIPRKGWFHPDMTEKLLTGTLNLNTNKQTLREQLKRLVKATPVGSIAWRLGFAWSFALHTLYLV